MLRIHQYFQRAYGVIFVFALLFIAIITYFWSKNIYLEQTEKNLIDNIEIIATTLTNLDKIDKKIELIKNRVDLRITIINEKGKIVAESDEDKTIMENHSNRPEIKKALVENYGVNIRKSSTIKKELLYVAKRVQIEDKIYIIRVADYIDKIKDNFLYLTIQILSLISILLLIAFIFTYKIGLKLADETNNILLYLDNLSTKNIKQKFQKSNIYEFNQISKLLQNVSKKLAKKDKQKARKTAKLKLANRQKDEIISAISHEFKNPLAIIQGYTQTLHSDMDKQTRDKFLDKIETNAVKIDSLIDRLRLSLKLDQNRQSISCKKVNILKIVETIIEDLEYKYPHRKIILNRKEIFVNADITLLNIAIENLIDNALKYSSDEVIVTIYDTSLEVSDKGIGIKQKELDKIEQKFYRISNNGWNNSMGLGLFIVKSILDLHKFELKISSKVNNGSKFSILF